MRLIRFIPNYVTTVHGFLRLRHSTIPFFWDDHTQYHFDAPKHALTSAPLISPPNFTKDFILYISASTHLVVGVLIQKDDNQNEHIIYYVSTNLIGPLVSYSHKEKLALVTVLSIQKLHHYILTCTTRAVINSNPMTFLLSRQFINGKYARWIVILQEFDLEFVKPKSKKALALTELISELPTRACDPLVNDELPNEYLFVITMDDPWYRDILTYLRTQKFTPHLTHDNWWRIQY